MEFLKKFEKNFKEGKSVPLGGRYQINAPIAYAKIGAHDDIGLELEIEGSKIPSAADLLEVKGAKSGSRWTAKADGSLRGVSAEYIFTMPTPAEEVPAMVEGFYKVCDTRKAKIIPSNRTSTHVHRNVSHYKVNQLTSILALWTTFEEILIEWCGEERKTNHFCLSAKDAVGCIEQWRRFLRTGSPDWPDHLKYSALNIYTIWTFGSFEARCAPSFTEPEKVIYWVKLFDSLVREACDTYFNPEKLATDISELGPEEIFRRILTRMSAEDDIKTWTDLVPDFRATAIDGFRRAQPILYELPWSDLLKKIESEYIPNPFKKAPAPKTRGFRIGNFANPEPDDRIEIDFPPEPDWREDNPAAEQPLRPVPHPQDAGLEAAARNLVQQLDQGFFDRVAARPVPQPNAAVELERAREALRRNRNRPAEGNF